MHNVHNIIYRVEDQGLEVFSFPPRWLRTRGDPPCIYIFIISYMVTIQVHNTEWIKLGAMRFISAKTQRSAKGELQYVS